MCLRSTSAKRTKTEIAFQQEIQVGTNIILVFVARRTSNKNRIDARCSVPSILWLLLEKLSIEVTDGNKLINLYRSNLVEAYRFTTIHDMNLSIYAGYR